MNLLLLLGTIVAFQDYEADGCFPRRTKELTDSYVPVGIQALHHYKSQLEVYLPLCANGKSKMANPQGNVCVAESMARINLFLIDLQREAAKQNLGDSEGLTSSILEAVSKTSRMTAAEQFYFILEKLKNERIPNLGCEIAEFQQDLENANSKLSRNFLNLKPLNYLYRKFFRQEAGNNHDENDICVFNQIEN